MSTRSLRSLFVLAALTARAAFAQSNPWLLDAPPSRASIVAGPWVLAEGTDADPLAGYPAPNPGAASFQPYYQSFVWGSDQFLQGVFDYRVKDTEEAVVSAYSEDWGNTWTFETQALEFDSPSLTDAGTPSDDGEGHPFVLVVGGNAFLYTLDRSAGSIDHQGLLVRPVQSLDDPLSGQADHAQQGASPVTRTLGLTQPDGFISAVPGTDNPVTVMWLQKALGTPDVTTVHLSDTFDGVTFANDRVVSGLQDASIPFIGPRGTLVAYDDGRYGLFYSAGLVGEDSDAYHFIGYAESPDLLNWTVLSGVSNPLLSTDPATDPFGGVDWYAGRVYAPNVTLSPDGCSATMIFSGCKTKSPKKAPLDYRQQGVLTLARDCGSDFATQGQSLKAHLPSYQVKAEGGCSSATGAPALLALLGGAFALRWRRASSHHV